MKKYKVFVQDTLKRIPFNSDRKKMSTIVSDPNYPTGHRVYMKGASEIVIKACTHIINPDNLSKRAKSDEESEKLKMLIKKFADLTLRTISVAYKDIKEEDVEHYQTKDEHNNMIIENTGFTMVALMGIKDTLRQGVPEAIEKCHKAGINVLMVTGDLKETAIAISKECGIWHLEDNKDIPEYYSMTGEEFFNAIGGIECEVCLKDEALCKCPKTKKMADDQGLDKESIQRQKVKDMVKFEAIIKDLRVLARSRPHDKFALVLGLRRLDYVVAVTGDGTNDAKALSKDNS